MLEELNRYTGDEVKQKIKSVPPILLSHCMNFKKYHLFFHSDTVRQITIQLEDTPVTECWVQNLQTAKCKDIVDIQMHFGGDIVQVESRLKGLVAILAQENPAILEYWKEPLTQEVMNRLHQYFHSSLEHQTCARLETSNALDELNIEIHRWETLRRKTSQSWAYYRLDTCVSQPITPELRKYWRLRAAPPGALRLGYYTVGKDLWNCYVDNDMQVIKDGLVRPQLDIHTQAIFQLNETKIYVTEETALARFDKWCDEMNTSAYGVHSKDPLHRGIMGPLLGVGQNLPTQSEMEHMWKTAEKITWTLE